MVLGRVKTLLSPLGASAAQRELPIVAVLVFLIPIWVFSYVPTQDGPVHLANSLILKDYGNPDNRFQEYYWINWRPLPNWTCFVLLAAFAHVVPPLIAEKLLVSLYLIGFVLAYRYFVAAVGDGSSWLVLAGFLLAFNRCFWLGFYNYCLSLVLYFVVVGYFLRRWERFCWPNALVLGALFCLIFFTHLFGFALAAASCLWLAVALPQKSLAKYLLLIGALVPAVVLTEVFFEEARFYSPGGFGRLQEYLWGWVEGIEQWERIEGDLLALNKHLFGIELYKTVYLAIGVAVLYAGFLLAGFWKPALAGSETSEVFKTSEVSAAAKLHAVFWLGLIFAALYFLLPDILTVGKGGFWKARLVLFPPLLWLACSRPTTVKSARYVLGAATLVLLSLNVGIVTSYIDRINQELAEFTAGLHVVGHDRTIYFSGRNPKEKQVAANPLYHAGEYYCLESQNINLEYPFATVLHSPVRLRPDIQQAGKTQRTPDRTSVDVIVQWGLASGWQPEGFRTIFQEGRLTILERTSD